MGWWCGILHFGHRIHSVRPAQRLSESIGVKFSDLGVVEAAEILLHMLDHVLKGMQASRLPDVFLHCLRQDVEESGSEMDVGHALTILVLHLDPLA